MLTGSDNKSVYNRAARAHVRAAMDGYNSVVFAYGQTASGTPPHFYLLKSDWRWTAFIQGKLSR